MTDETYASIIAKILQPNRYLDDGPKSLTPLQLKLIAEDEGIPLRRCLEVLGDLGNICTGVPGRHADPDRQKAMIVALRACMGIKSTAMAMDYLVEARSRNWRRVGYFLALYTQNALPTTTRAPGFFLGGNYGYPLMAKAVARATGCEPLGWWGEIKLSAMCATGMVTSRACVNIFGVTAGELFFQEYQVSMAQRKVWDCDLGRDVLLLARLRDQGHATREFFGDEVPWPTRTVCDDEEAFWWWIKFF